MIRFRCDRCGQSLDADSSERYIVAIEAYAAAAPLAFTQQELEKDHRAEIKAILDQLHQANPDRVEDQVYRRFRFDLCAACHRRFLEHPLGS